MKRLVLALATLSLAPLPLLSQPATVVNQPTPDAALAAHAAAIPFEEIGVVAGKQYSSDGLAVASSTDGAKLRCLFQRLDADLTSEGMWLVSTKGGAKGQPFRVIARALGRASVAPLAPSGTVEIAGQVARFLRPGLTEEYSVGIDGLQQDFVIGRRPAGEGSVRLELEVDGAKAEAVRGGARLVLADGGRQMVYNRLRARDARGRQLTAGVEVVSAQRLAVVLDDAGAEYPVRIDPTFSDANWVSLGGLPGVDGTIYAAAVDDAGNLYIGGSFSVSGSVVANNVAEWNGISWSALGAGISGTNDYGGGPWVSALSVSGTNLYVGGVFTTAGGVSARNIAQWNGSTWSALGTGISGTNDSGAGPSVSALGVSGSNLYVGGAFGTAGGTSANNVARWNGTSWSVLGNGISGTNDYGGGPAVAALAVSGSNLFVGGDSTTAGGVPANDVAQWNGTSWAALGSGLSGGVFVPGDPAGYSIGPHVSALAASGTNLFVGGSFTDAGGVGANSVAQWNGSSWSGLGGWLEAEVLALAVSGNTLFVGTTGRTLLPVIGQPSFLAQWNGSVWSDLGSGLNGPVPALALDTSGNLYVGGAFTTAGTNVSACIAKALLTGPAPNQLLLSNTGGGTNVLTYLGTPGANYALDLATNLAPPVNWKHQMTNTASIGNAAIAGCLMFTNSNHLPQAYYRTRYVP